MDQSEDEISIAFTNTSLAYTVSDIALVNDWLHGRTPTGGPRTRPYENGVSLNPTGTPTPSKKPSVFQRMSIGDTLSTFKDKMSHGGDENKERGNWSGRLDFVLSMLGYAVGLGNVWRFPYLCYRNGGGAFILPYLMMLAFVGLPLFYLEVCLGQFCSRGAAKCWDFAPIFKGVGVAMIVSSTLVSIYYNMIIAWSIFYTVASFTSHLPWTDCDNPNWNTPDCSLLWPLVDCVDGRQLPNGTCYHESRFVGVWNSTLFEEVTGRRRISPSEEYWTHHVLGKSSGVFDPGRPRWHLALCLLLAWVITFFCLLKGIKTTGKVVYFTALFPYVVLTILFFRGVTLEAAGQGILFYIKPDFERLLDAKVWRDAGNQIFYSLGPAWGGLITLSSYNRFHNNALRDSLIVGIGNSMTSLFGGFVIFSYLGYMAKQLNVEVSKVATSGPGLAFIVYPEAVTSLPAPPLWSVLFFFMLILLGLDSQFATVETMLTGFLDQWPKYRSKKTLTILIICVALFLLGLPLTTNGGAYMLNLMDTYAASWSLMIIGLTETLALSWVYGINRFFLDMTLMFGRTPSIWWKICWTGVSPSIILFILLFACVDYSPATYGDYTYPIGAEILGWLMVLASILWIPICAIYKLYMEDEGKSLLQKLRLQSLPNRYWGPALVKHRKLVDYVTDFVIDPEGEKRALSFINRGFSKDEQETTHTHTHTHTSYRSTYEQEDRISVGTRDASLTTASFDDDIMFTSTVSLETSV